MIALSELKVNDLWQLKWQLLAVLLSILLAVGMYLTTGYIKQNAQRELLGARTEYNSARTQLDEIEEQEATIIANIDSFQNITERGISAPEDRLAMLENFAQIRARHSLFPVQVNIEGQRSLQLQYETTPDNTDRPVYLQQSVIEFALPLLHEDDLLRLLRSLMELPEFLQLESCELERQGGRPRQYNYLGNHFQSSCTVNWFSLSIGGEPE